MRKLFLIRHAQPEVIPDTPPRLWPLTPEGRKDAQQLAQRLVDNDQPTLLYASPEPKANATAQIIAQHLNVPVETIADLREHERGQTPLLGKDAWEATISSFFSQPDELIFGSESAHQSLQRFRAAVEKIISSNPYGNLAIATHGTVLTLFVACYNPQIDTMAFWRSLKCPDLVVLTLPELKLTSK